MKPQRIPNMLGIPNTQHLSEKLPQGAIAMEWGSCGLVAPRYNCKEPQSTDTACIHFYICVVPRVNPQGSAYQREAAHHGAGQALRKGENAHLDSLIPACTCLTRGNSMGNGENNEVLLLTPSLLSLRYFEEMIDV